MEELGRNPKILIVDSYDSFTHNLAALVIRTIPSSEVFIIRNNQFDLPTLLEVLPFFSALIVGPGPGSPENIADIGIVKDLWHLPEQNLLPIFGVCLGLQSLAVEYGATLRRLPVVKHGQISRIVQSQDSLFEGITKADVVRYHSLHVEIADASQLEQLAWADDGAENGRVVMAIKHRTKPFWAVQYHPESVCTDGSGLRVIQNFWSLALQWHVASGRNITPWNCKLRAKFGQAWPYLRPRTISAPFSNSRQERPTVTTLSLNLPMLTIPQICEGLGVQKNTTDFVLLDSASQPGRYSIIGCLLPSTLKITYFAGDSSVRLERFNRRTSVCLGPSDIWSWLSSVMHAEQTIGGNQDLPFWGGFIGYISYEAGVDSIAHRQHHASRLKSQRYPDVSLVFVERSVVVDCKAGVVFLQSLIPGDNDWFASTTAILNRAAFKASHDAKPLKQHRRTVTKVPRIVLPDKDKYIARVKLAKEYLFAGESYELCFTARTRVYVPHSSPSLSPSSSWDLYRRLRSVNPAPYATFLRLHPLTLISSSPERFLSYSRPPFQKCQLRPIKGTVRKSKGMTRMLAEKVLGNSKEVAENLMIVDLIRHDLHGVVGNHVEVKQFCGVEEYKTLWQSVSVVEGALPISHISPWDQIGWDVLRSCLPPGSMTGAPKKRSVEILHDLEDEERGAYSGVVGYWCVGGSGDWSVVIRSCFKYTGSGDDAREDDVQGQMASGTDEWVIGAGGAITALSDPEAEWDEMVAKLQSVLRAFVKETDGTP